MNVKLVSIAVISLLFGPSAAAADRLSLLFLGDGGPHQPPRRAAELLPPLASRGIDVIYSDDVAGTLNPQRLSEFDGLILYANIDRITTEQAEALLSYVDGGGAFIPLHCASYCFRNNEKIVALIGAQFSRHGSGVFSVSPTDAAADHPIMKGYPSFESWDETYVHTKHNETDRTVLEYRQEGDTREPWTWVRTHGAGRVFYTAWGHDQRTFSQPGFHDLVERGIRWACRADLAKNPGPLAAGKEALANLEMTPQRTDVLPFEYVDVGPKIPNYVNSKQWGQQEAPRNTMQKPLAPAESAKHYIVPKGFSLELFAAEPDIGGKPICMNWDARGRLWLAETYDYPNERQPAGNGRDRIRICEDTDGDGKADKFVIFADQLSIPTSLAFSHGGVIVHQAPDTLFLIDTDGDDVADQRQVLFSGWKTNDTHAGPSHLNYGHDNWFYGMVGYAGFDGKIAGRQQAFRTGFYRFKVERVAGEVAVTDFEFLRNTNNNSWGLGISEQGLLFGSTANRNPSEFMPIPNRYYERVRGWTSSVLTGIADTHEFAPITENVRQVDHHGGYTAAAGHALYTARNYPPEYWNRTAFVAGPTGHLVGTFVLQPSGAGFRSSSPANLLASDDEWAAPIMAEVGPDGNVWVIDWYNYIVQHNPTPVGFKNGPGNAYMTDLRDKTHGRIYRVSYGDSRDVAAPTPIENVSSSELVDALSSSNMFWRRHAQRLLVERGASDVIPALVALVHRNRIDSIGLDVGAIHAIRTLQGLGAFDSGANREVLSLALNHLSPGVVRTAIEAMPRDAAAHEMLINSQVLQSKDAQVQLSTLLALADMPESDQSAVIAMESISKPKNLNDRWMLDAATSAAATSSQSFLVLACQQSSSLPPVLATTAIVAQHVARTGNQAALQTIVAKLSDAPTEIVSAILDGWSKGWQAGNQVQVSASVDQSLVKLLDTLPPNSKSQLIRLAKFWNSERLSAEAKSIALSLLKVAQDDQADGGQRISAVAELIGLLPEDAEVITDVLQSVTPRTPVATATGMIDSLRNSRAKELSSIMLNAIDQFTPTTRTALVQTMLARPEMTIDLLSAIDRKEISQDDLSLVQQQALLAHPTAQIRSRAKDVLRKSGGLPDSDREKVLASLMSVTEMTGNPQRGKQVFVKHCSNCHTHHGEGKKVGPDLSGMAVHPKAELLTQIVDPSRSVEGNYRSYTALTVDGMVINGMLAAETQTALEIIDSKGEHQIVLREDIEKVVASRKSVMPEGFEKQIDQQGFIDLLEFLTTRGKFLPLPLGKAATAISTQPLFHGTDNGPDRLVLADWSPKMIGEVPFQLIDPQGDRIANIVLLNGSQGTLPPSMPKSVRIPCNSVARKIHLLSGVSGWGYPAHQEKTVSLIVRLHLQDGSSEDHPLRNGIHFADYIRRVDVSGSEFAMMVGDQQLRHIVIEPNTEGVIGEVELVKGDDPTAPIIVAITIEVTD